MEQNDVPTQNTPFPEPGSTVVVDGVGVCQRPRTLREKVANFWYHYKIHTLIALFLLAVIAVSVGQCATAPKYDGYLLVACGKPLARLSENGETSDYTAAMNVLRSLVGDKNGDGKLNLSLCNLYCPSEEELAALSPQDREAIAYTYTQDRKSLQDLMESGEYHVCFLSLDIFNSYDLAARGSIFADLTPYLPATVADGKQSGSLPGTRGFSAAAPGKKADGTTVLGSGIVLSAESGADGWTVLPNGMTLSPTNRGILLSSTPLASLPGLNALPSDTVICLRKPSALVSALNKKQEQADFAAGEELLRALLAFSAE